MELQDYYFVWVGLSVIASFAILWPLAWWSGRKKRHPVVLVSAILTTLLCLAPLMLWHSLASSRTLLLLPLSPFIACIAIAQLAIRLSFDPESARWGSYVISALGAVLIAFLFPFVALAASCAIDGECLDI